MEMLFVTFGTLLRGVRSSCWVLMLITAATSATAKIVPTRTPTTAPPDIPSVSSPVPLVPPEDAPRPPIAPADGADDGGADDTGAGVGVTEVGNVVVGAAVMLRVPLSSSSPEPVPVPSVAGGGVGPDVAGEPVPAAGGTELGEWVLGPTVLSSVVTVVVAMSPYASTMVVGAVVGNVGATGGEVMGSGAPVGTVVESIDGAGVATDVLQMEMRKLPPPFRLPFGLK